MPTVSDFKEREENRERYLSQLKDVLKQKKICEGLELEDKFLIKFLRSRNYNVDVTSDAIKNYSNLFKKHPQFFDGLDSLQHLYEEGIFKIIPDLNSTGEGVGILCPGIWNPSNSTFEQVLVTTVYAYELALLNESAQINGMIEVIDTAEIGLRQFLRIGMSEILLGIEMTEKALPIRWRKICILNQNSFVDIVWSIAKRFMSKDLRETFMFIGSDMTKLHELVSPEILPPKFGGTSDKCDPNEYFKNLKNSEPELMKLWQPFKEYHKNKN